jgi:hypothetical protein
MLDFGSPGLPHFAFCGPLGNFDQNFAYVDSFFYTCRSVIGQENIYTKYDAKIESHHHHHYIIFVVEYNCQTP